MKTFVPFLFLILLATSGFAQKETFERSYLAFRVGVAAPIGDFGSKDVQLAESGLAENGLHISADYSVNFNKYFGAGITVGVRRNDLDLSEYPTTGGGSPLYAHTKWRTNYLLLNALVNYPIFRTLAFYGKLSGGVSFNTYPDLAYSTSSPTTNKELVRSEALAYGTGLGLKFLPGNVGITVETTALFTQPVFKGYSLSAKQQMNSLNYSFGLIFKLK